MGATNVRTTGLLEIYNRRRSVEVQVRRRGIDNDKGLSLWVGVDRLPLDPCRIRLLLAKPTIETGTLPSVYGHDIFAAVEDDVDNERHAQSVCRYDNRRFSRLE